MTLGLNRKTRNGSKLSSKRSRDAPIWNFADNSIIDCCIKVSADIASDTDIDAYVLS